MKNNKNLDFNIAYCQLMLKDAQSELKYLQKHNHARKNAVGNQCLWCNPCLEEGKITLYTCSRVMELERFATQLANQISQFNQMKLQAQNIES